MWLSWYHNSKPALAKSPFLYDSWDNYINQMSLFFVKVHNLSSKIAEVSIRQRGDKINNWNKDVKTENDELNFKWQICLLFGAVYIAVDNLTFRYWNTPETDRTKTLCRGVREWINCYLFPNFLTHIGWLDISKTCPFHPALRNWGSVCPHESFFILMSLLMGCILESLWKEENVHRKSKH